MIWCVKMCYLYITSNSKNYFMEIPKYVETEIRWTVKTEKNEC